MVGICWGLKGGGLGVASLCCVTLDKSLTLSVTPFFLHERKTMNPCLPAYLGALFVQIRHDGWELL